ncbi:MAG: hypothetical protein SOT19_06910 [Muribaculaceae bacterium]|nr:hypothetical protein [Muribaculaceae bacterium]
MARFIQCITLLPLVSAMAQATLQSDVMTLPNVLQNMLTQQGLEAKGISKDQYRIGVDINQTVYDGGLISGQQKVARLEGQGQSAQTETDLYAIRGRINDLYFSILLIDRKIELNRDLQTLLSSNLDCLILLPPHFLSSPPFLCTPPHPPPCLKTRYYRCFWQPVRPPRRFYNRFKDDATYNEDLARIAKFVESIADLGALERFFRPEGKMNDRVCALPVIRSKLRLYCLRLSDSILILGNGGVKKTRTYDEDDELRGFVVTLQNFDKHIKEGVKDGTIAISENEIETAQSETPVHEISSKRGLVWRKGRKRAKKNTRKVLIAGTFTGT